MTVEMGLSILHLALIALAAPVTGAPSETAELPASSSPDHDNRDGAGEARGIVEEGSPARLYSHVFNGRAPGFMTPGLRNCDPLRNAGAGKGILTLFLPLPEADFQEGSSNIFDEESIAASEFALAFNLEMFRLREDEIREACPQVELMVR